MTTRNLAATAAALPHDTAVNRRMILARAGAAAVLAAIGPAAASPAIDLDADLMMMRLQWVAARAALDDAIGEHDAATMRMYALPGWPLSKGDPKLREEARKEAGADVTRVRQEQANEADDAVVNEIAAMQARTLAGLAFKVEVSADWDHDHEALTPSIMADVAAFAAAHPALPI